MAGLGGIFAGVGFSIQDVEYAGEVYGSRTGLVASGIIGELNMTNAR